MCCRTRYALKGVMVGNCIYFFVYHCSCQSLGDLSTTLEMTVLSQLFFTRKVIFLCRHFDQVKRVEKSPKAEQWLSNTLNLPYFSPMDSLSYILTFQYFLKAIRQSIFSHSNSLVYLTQYFYPLYFNLLLL